MSVPADPGNPTRRSAVIGLAAGLLPGSALGAGAARPSRTIKLVVPFTPGGSTDILARVVAQRLEAELGKPVVVENRGGAGGTIAAAGVAKAEPDGHTLMMGHIGTLAFAPALYNSLAYDPMTAFAPVAMIASVPNILVVHPGTSVASTGELIAAARASPRSLHYGSGGNGSAAHVATAYFSRATAIELVHVPYRGTAPAVNDLVGGHIQLMMTGGPALLPLIASGHLRALAVSSLSRVPFLAGVPTIAEAAVAGFEAVQWYGVVAPARTPVAVIERLNRVINAALATHDVAAGLVSEGAVALPMTTRQFGAHITAEIARWGNVIREAGITTG
jgi:tripartite-type tricarboxylate transporter receptor subunit TctC